jgi:hypothetical protein
MLIENSGNAAADKFFFVYVKYLTEPFDLEEVNLIYCSIKGGISQGRSQPKNQSFIVGFEVRESVPAYLACIFPAAESLFFPNQKSLTPDFALC